MTDVRTAPTWQALLSESAFTQEMLAAGATYVRQANYASKGKYFQAFTSLSTGLERIGKICLWLDSYAKHGRVPSDDFKKGLGHDLVKITERARDAIEDRGMTARWADQPIHNAALRILSDFARGDRYQNLNVLLQTAQSQDPIARWSRDVDEEIWINRLPAARRSRVEMEAMRTHSILNASASVNHLDDQGRLLTNVYEGALASGKWEAVSPTRQLVVLQIIRQWADTINLLQDPAQAVPGSEVPFLSEFFGAFRNDDGYFKSRKRWDNL